jgi:hypothetical protein
MSSSNIFKNNKFQKMTNESNESKELLEKQEELLKNQIIFKDYELLNNIDEESLKKQELLNIQSLELLAEQEKLNIKILELLNKDKLLNEKSQELLNKQSQELLNKQKIFQLKNAKMIKKNNSQLFNINLESNNKNIQPADEELLNKQTQKLELIDKKLEELLENHKLLEIYIQELLKKQELLKNKKIFIEKQLFKIYKIYIDKLLKINKSFNYDKNNLHNIITSLNNKNKKELSELFDDKELLKKFQSSKKTKIQKFFTSKKNKLSNENKDKINKLLKSAKKIKNNTKIKQNKLLSNMNKERGFINFNSDQRKSEIFSINNININKITIMVEVVHKYYEILNPSIKEIFKDKFKDFFRKNIKVKESKERKLYLDKSVNNLTPEIYNSSIKGNFKITNIKPIGEGSYGKVYKNISSVEEGKNKIIESSVLKIIKDNSDGKKEFVSLIFNICLLAFLYLNNNNGIKYFCDLYEFGKIKNNNTKFYALMENGGNELLKINFHPKNKSLSDVLFIIKECAMATKILHDIDIIHCDIKPANFLFNEKNGNYNIKIIDFGFATKNGTLVTNWFGSPLYMPLDFINSIKYNKKCFTKNTRIKIGCYTITKKNDIYALGITFIELLYINLDSYFNYSDKNHIKIQKIIKEIRRRYELLVINQDIINKFINLLINILEKMTYYLSSSYDDLSEFIDNINELIILHNSLSLK